MVKAKGLVLRDTAVIVALIPGLFASHWLGVRLGRLLLPIVPTHQLGMYVGLVTFPLLGVVTGVFHFLCGYLLARWLRRVNPWHVVGGLAAIASALAVWATPWGHLSQMAALEGTTVPILLVQDAIGPLCLVLFLSLGIWWQHRQPGVDELH